MKWVDRQVITCDVRNSDMARPNSPSMACLAVMFPLAPTSHRLGSP